MNNPRKYGSSPYKIAVIHGGPGCQGQMAEVARELSGQYGVLEPLQTASSIEGQIRELHDILIDNAQTPITMIGHSWGAMLSILFTSKHPELVEKLIFVSSGPLDPKFTSADIMKVRLERMSDEEKAELEIASKKLVDPDLADKDSIFAQLGRLAIKIDSYDLLPSENDKLKIQYDIFCSVWGEAEKLRSSGGFIDALKNIKCRVLAIHGDHDPHSANGVKMPLTANIKELQFILLEKCGHYPWLERHAKSNFYSILNNEFKNQD